MYIYIHVYIHVFSHPIVCRLNPHVLFSIPHGVMQKKKNENLPRWIPITATFVAGEGDGSVGRDFKHAGETAHIEPSHATTVPRLSHTVLLRRRWWFLEIPKWFELGFLAGWMIPHHISRYFWFEVILSSKFFYYCGINGFETHIIQKKKLKISMAPSHLVLGHWTQFPQGGVIDELRISFSTLYVGDSYMFIAYLSVFAVFGGVISNSFAGQSSAIRVHDVSVVACLPTRLFFASPFGWPSYHSWYEVKPGFWLAMAGYILNVFVAYASLLASMLIGPPRVSLFCPTWWHVISTCFLAQFMGAQDRFAGSSCRQNVDIGVSVDILHVTLC